jgi:hypothetical protein
MLNKLKWVYISRTLLAILLLIMGITYFSRNTYRDVEIINPELYKEPLQFEAIDKTPIMIEIDGFDYTLTPLYYYEISGLLVHKKDYSWLSIYKRNKALPIDLCLIWGDNVESGVYKSKDLKFTQDFRFCRYRWKGNLNFNKNEISNNHLLISNEYINEEVKGLNRGDQVKIIGRLVNVTAKNLSDADSYDPRYFELNTSTTRTDTGKGACEIIYVEDFEILMKANRISSFLFSVSIYGLILLCIVNIVRFFKRIP